MNVTSLEPFGALVTELGPAWLDDGTGDLLPSLLMEHGVICFRGHDFDVDEQERLMALFGPLVDEGTGEHHFFIEHDPSDGDSMKPDARPNLSAEALAYHTEYSAASTRGDSDPVSAISLRALELPTSGGETCFASGSRALEELDPSTRERLGAAQARHVSDPNKKAYTQGHTREELSGEIIETVHPVIRSHPDGGPEFLYVNRLTAIEILDLDTSESDEVLAMLFETIYQPSNIYSHTWVLGDLLVWDNRVVQHARREFDPSQRRRLCRVAVGDQELLNAHIENVRLKTIA